MCWCEKPVRCPPPKDNTDKMDEIKKKS